MTTRTKNLGRNLKQGDYALDLVTGFPVIIRDETEGAFTRYCEFFGLNPGFGGVYSRNLKPITVAEFRSLMEKRLSASSYYFHPLTQRYSGVYDRRGALVCLTVYKKRAEEVVKRLKLLSESCRSAIRYITYSMGSSSFKAKSMIEVIHNTLEQTEGPNGKVQETQRTN